MSNLQSWLLGLNILISSMFQASEVLELKAFKWPLKPKPFECDAPGFQPGYLTLMIRSTELTLVKRRPTWDITSKTSPTTPNDTPWPTHGQGLVKTLVKPLEHPFDPPCRPKLLPRSPNFT
jgi:hypothetical protein